MKKILSGALCAIAIVAAMAGLSSCNNDKARQEVATDAETLNGKLGKIMADAPDVVSDFKMSANEKDVTVSAAVKPEAFDLKLLDSVLADFAMASYLHADGGADEDVVSLINNMTKAEMPLELSLTQGDTRYQLTRTAAQLKAFKSTDLASLNRATAATNMAELLSGIYATKFKTDAATDYQCMFMGQTLEITVTYPNRDASPFAKIANPANVLKGDMADFTDAYLALYGSLEPAVRKLFKDLGLMKIHIVYKAADNDKENITGAFYEFSF